MSWRRVLGRLARSSRRRPSTRPRARAADQPPESPTAVPDSTAPPGRARPRAPDTGDGARPEFDAYTDEEPVLSEAELRELREALAHELERVAEREREAAS